MDAHQGDDSWGGSADDELFTVEGAEGEGEAKEWDCR